MKVTLVFFLAAAVVLCSARPREQEALSRLPRSLQPGAPSVSAPGQGSQGKDNGDGIGVDIQREKGVGTMVSGSGQQTWSSKDGKTDVRVNGQWSRVYNGPRAGGPNHRMAIYGSKQHSNKPLQEAKERVNMFRYNSKDAGHKYNGRADATVLGLTKMINYFNMGCIRDHVIY